MADAKTQIVTHNGRIVVVGGSIIMGPCEPNTYYVRLMIGDETMEDWWNRLRGECLVDWSNSSLAGYANQIKYYDESRVGDASLPQIKERHYDSDTDTFSLHWSVGDSYSDKALGIVRFGTHPEVGLYWNGSYQFYYDSEERDYLPKFSTRRKDASVPAGCLDDGTFVVSFAVFGEYWYHYEYHETWPAVPDRDKHVSTEVPSSRADRGLFKFKVSNVEMGKGLAGSNFNVEVIGYGDWSREIRETDKGNISDMTLVPTIEIVRVKKDKDGNPVEEVVWQSR